MKKHPRIFIEHILESIENKKDHVEKITRDEFEPCREAYISLCYFK